MISKNINLDRLYPPEHFNDSPVGSALITKEKNIWNINRAKEENKHVYATFDELMLTYLSKLPNNNVKTYVNELMSKRLINIGSSSNSSNDVVFARILMTPQDKVTAIILDSNVLDINVSTGETTAIDDCVYASYFGFIRASILASKDEILQDRDLHKLLTHYVYLVVLQAVGQQTIYNAKQKNLVHLACIYAYNRHYLGHKHAAALNVIKRDFKELISKEMMAELLPSFEKISKYDTMKDIPNILIALGVFHEKPTAIHIKLFRILGNSGFYAFIGPFDQFLPMVVLSKYPTNLYPKTAMTNVKVQDSVEKLITKYIKKVKFELSSVVGNK